MTQPVVSVQHLQQGYRKRPVLNDLSLEVLQGQTFALLGRNGAGKTTLIRTLLGLLRPMSGSVQVLGLDPFIDAQEVRRRVGYLAEDQAMYGWMDARQIAAFLAPFYPGWDKRLLADLLDRFEVPQDTKIKHLSKGENIRLALALSLAHRPELVILDDPALGLDPITRKQFNRDVIDQLQAEGRTVLYSSHLLYEVEPIADAVAILDQGQIVRVGLTEDLHRDVKRVILPRDALERIPRPEKLLDILPDAERILVTLDDAPKWLELLDEQAVPSNIEDLSLDEIFEAFVIGDRSAWPTSERPLRAVSA